MILIRREEKKPSYCIYCMSSMDRAGVEGGAQRFVVAEPADPLADLQPRRLADRASMRRHILVSLAGSNLTSLPRRRADLGQDLIPEATRRRGDDADCSYHDACEAARCDAMVSHRSRHQHQHQHRCGWMRAMRQICFSPGAMEHYYSPRASVVLSGHSATNRNPGGRAETEIQRALRVALRRITGTADRRSAMPEEFGNEAHAHAHARAGQGREGGSGGGRRDADAMQRQICSSGVAGSGSTVPCPPAARSPGTVNNPGA